MAHDLKLFIDGEFPRSESGPKVRLGLRVYDAGVAVREIAASGGKVVDPSGPRKLPTSIIEDPDGNVVELEHDRGVARRWNHRHFLGDLPGVGA